MSRSGDRRLDSVVTLWAAGVQPSRSASFSAWKRNRRGQVIVNQTLNPPGHPEIFVCGDLTHFEQDGHQLPGVAQPAMQMGDHVGKMIAEDLNRQPRTPFRYFDKGDVATIGRMAAVAHLKWPVKANLSGFLAWITWLTVHIYFLIGFRNRATVLFDWVWTIRPSPGERASSTAAKTFPDGPARQASSPKPKPPPSTRPAPVQDLVHRSHFALKNRFLPVS